MAVQEGSLKAVLPGALILHLTKDSLDAGMQRDEDTPALSICFPINMKQSEGGVQSTVLSVWKLRQLGVSDWRFGVLPGPGVISDRNFLLSYCL